MNNEIDLEDIIYTKLTDYEESIGWDKDTINYAIEKEKLLKGEAFQLLSRYYVTADEIDEIYQNFLIELYNTKDYDISTAWERSSSDTPITLENYVKYLLKCSVNRYKALKINEPSYVVPKKDPENGNEVSPLDMIGENDDKIDKLYETLDDMCKTYEYKRYACNIDLFLIMYILLKTNENIAYFNELINIFDINKKDFEKELSKTEFIEIKKCAMELDNSTALEIIGKYVFSKNKIDELFNNIYTA